MSLYFRSKTAVFLFAQNRWRHCCVCEMVGSFASTGYDVVTWLPKECATYLVLY